MVRQMNNPDKGRRPGRMVAPPGGASGNEAANRRSTGRTANQVPFVHQCHGHSPNLPVWRFMAQSRPIDR